MSVSPYTLNNLYQNGILDFVSMDLCYPMAPNGGMNMQNPYMNAAMQGNLYQQYGNQADSFTSSGVNYYDSQIGTQSTMGTAFTGSTPGIGAYSNNNVSSMFGFNGIGSQSDAGVSMFGATGIGGQSNVGLQNTFGGFNDAKNGVNNAVSKVTGMPTMLKGLIAAGLILLTVGTLFKGKKAPKAAVKTGSKWNPINWFKKSPKPAAKPAKKGFIARLKTRIKK